MIHARRKIVNTVAALVRSTESCRLVTTRQHERPDFQDLPYCCVVATSEENEALTIGAQFLDSASARIMSRSLLVQISVMAAGLDGVDDALDDIAAQIEVALATPRQLGLQHLVRSHLLQSVKFDRVDSGAEAPLSSMTMDVLVTYLVPDNYPLVED